MHTFSPGNPELRCVTCRRAFDFQAGDEALVLRHVSYGYDFVHDSACLNTATELMFPEPGYDCEAFYRDLERQRVLGVAPADRWAAIVPASGGNVVRREPLLCWALVEYRDGTISMEGLIRDNEWRDEPGGAEFAKNVRRIRPADESDCQLAAA
jgi:hypothetical protein